MKRKECPNHPSLDPMGIGTGCLVAEAYNHDLEKVTFENERAVAALANGCVKMSSRLPDDKLKPLGTAWVFTWNIPKQKEPVFVVLSEEADAIVTFQGQAAWFFEKVPVALALAKTRQAIEKKA